MSLLAHIRDGLGVDWKTTLFGSISAGCGAAVVYLAANPGHPDIMLAFGLTGAVSHGIQTYFAKG